YYIRSEGMINDLHDIEEIVVANRGGMPVHVKDLGKVGFGAPKRFGAMTMDGEGECVGGIAMMLKGANANAVTKTLEERVEKVQKMLPEGVSIEPYLNRSELVDRNISTVIKNLIEGALIVFLVLMLFLGDIRAGIITASVIPLAMLFAFIMMRLFGVSANLMSLGAIDFGIVVDGSIVILEGILAHIYSKKAAGKTYTQEEMDNEVVKGASKVVKSATFAAFIILIVFFPILTLTGIEGKYFTPMAKTLVFCIIGALILSLTYVPMMASLFLKKKVPSKKTFADRFFSVALKYYNKALSFCLRHVGVTIGSAFALLAASILLFTRLGAEFIPTLDEGDFAMQMTLPAGSSLSSSIDISLQAEKILKDNFPEIKHVVAKIGTAEVPTDPMSVEDADVMIVMKPFKEWTSASSRAEMVEKMKASLEVIDGAEFNFSQPIQLRFNELMTGAKADIAIKLYGEDMDELYSKALEAAEYVRKVPGADDVIVEQAMGLPQLVVNYDRHKTARYGIDIEELNTIIRTAYAGGEAGVVFENERRFDLVLRLDDSKVSDLDLNRLYVRTCNGNQVPVSEVADISLVNGPLQINRDATKRRIVIGVNVRDADIQKVVSDIASTLEKNISLKPGYYWEYGGQFENLQNAIKTLSIVIPIALLLILLILFFAFKSVTYALVVFMTVPLSLIGGIAALWLRGLPFSISAGVGFIALFGVAVLNGILMINRFNSIQNSSNYKMCTDRVLFKGCASLLRPVLLTGLVASLGFVPMAVAKSAGAEVQRPLATVVIGGLLVSTILTLVVLPALYRIVNSIPAIYRKMKGRNIKGKWMPVLLMLIIPFTGTKAQESPKPITLDEAIQITYENSPRLKMVDCGTVKGRAMKAEAWDGGSTNFSYSWGQINGEDFSDNEFTVEQSLGSLLTPFYKNALANTVIAESANKRTIVEKELKAEVKRAWIEYISALSTYKLTCDQAELGKKLSEISSFRYDKGDINQLEYRMMATVAAEAGTKKAQAYDDLLLAGKRFSRICCSDEPIVPADTSLSVNDYMIPEGVSSAFMKSIDFNVKLKQDLLKIEKSKFFPEFTVGYTRQKIAPIIGLQYWSAGVSIPIIFAPYMGRVKQAKADMMEARWEAEDSRRILNGKVEDILTGIEKQRKTIEYYKTSALAEADEIQRNAMILYKAGETDLSALMQSLSIVKETKMNYIEAVKEYNILQIELELYTE
ncbi:MAG: CusA/CzcA family heavy metal efflux RND transporter, partial [Candidatus Cryptobacteroides sp.]